MNETNRSTNIEEIKDKKDKINNRNEMSIVSLLDKRRSILSGGIARAKSNTLDYKHTPRYGWIPDIPDNRDYPYSIIRDKVEKEKIIPITTSGSTPIISTPSVIDLRSIDSPIFDQGNLGSCTGNSLAGALQFLEKKDKVNYITLSRLFIYFDERVIENTVGIDSGAQIRDGIKTLAKLGVCSENCWPYDIRKFAIQPGHKCYTEASNHKILSYYRLSTLDDMIHCLNSGYPFVFGFSVYSNFESQEVANTGIVNLPASSESLLGGHAVMAIGYDDNQKRFIVRNSWGLFWGQKGYFTIPFDYLTNRNLSDDFWTIRRGMNL